jgi:hypothetical protein
MYHFLSGYTARVAGTEIGVTEPEATFSTCFGAPFMPRHPSVYGNLLKERIAKGGVKCWLVNTGWSGGKATMEGIKRMPIKATRALLNAALDGSLNDASSARTRTSASKCRSRCRRGQQAARSARKLGRSGGIRRTARTLVRQFIDNFAQFADHVDESVARPRSPRPKRPRPAGNPGALTRGPEPSGSGSRVTSTSRTMPTDDPVPHRRGVRRVGRGLLDHSLAEAEWTHEAHLAACPWLLRESPDIVPERDLPAIIRCVQLAVGGENTDSAGYHETDPALRHRHPPVRGCPAAGTPLADAVHRLLESEIAARDWPLRFYSRDRLFRRSAPPVRGARSPTLGLSQHKFGRICSAGSLRWHETGVRMAPCRSIIGTGQP